MSFRRTFKNHQAPRSRGRIRLAIAFLVASLAGNALAMSEWDPQILKWRRESPSVGVDQIPQLEQKARKGDVRATYLLYLGLDRAPLQIGRAHV